MPNRNRPIKKTVARKAVAPKKVFARVLVRPPVRPSNGAQTIRRELGALAKISRVEPIPINFKIILNWGNSNVPRVNHDVRYINKPSAVGNAACKLRSLTLLRDAGVPVPLFSTKPPQRSDDIYLARTVLRGSGGDGIVVVRPGAVYPPAPLYVQYIRKTVEYRVHVAGGRAIFAQQKKKKADAEQTEDQKLIRNYDNGWVFCPLELDQVLPAAKEAAVNAVRALGLDFGAVDMILSKKGNNPYVLEVNTAPGLESPGLIAAYTDAFRAML